MVQIEDYTRSYPSCRTSSSLLVRICFLNLSVKPEGVLLLSLQTAKKKRNNLFKFQFYNNNININNILALHG